MDGRGSRLAATLANVKDIVTSVAGIVTVVVSALTALGIGVVVGHSGAKTAQPAAAVTQTVTVTVPAASGSRTSSPPPASPSSQPTTTAAAKFLTSVEPAQNDTVRGVINGPVTIGNAEFPQSLRITCQNQKTSLAYPVGGSAFFDATVGVPDGAANATDNSTQVLFAKDGTTDVLAAPVTVRVGKPQKVHIPLAGATQLVISCQAEASHGFNLMDIAFGDAALG